MANAIPLPTLSSPADCSSVLSYLSASTPTPPPKLAADYTSCLASFPSYTYPASVASEQSAYASELSEWEAANMKEFPGFFPPETTCNDFLATYLATQTAAGLGMTEMGCSALMVMVETTTGSATTTGGGATTTGSGVTTATSSPSTTGTGSTNGTSPSQTSGSGAGRAKAAWSVGLMVVGAGLAALL